MLLTKSTTFIIGPIAEIIGYIMNGIFFILGKIGLPNIGLSIIFMTILIYMAMLPLTIRQQKFSKLQRKMQPELNKIQKKYQGRKDSQSVAAQQEEMKQVYDKYGVSATGSCVQLAIQMPILFALYRVFYNIPAYLPLVKEAFYPLVDNLYELDPKGAILLAQNADEKYIFYNYFLGLDIAESPSNVMKKGGIMIVVALIIPFLAAFTQWLNIKLMPQPNADPNDPTANSMKTMNLMMPAMSAVFCFSLPSGMGLYWIIGAIVRIVQQIFINKHIDKMDIDEMIEKNSEKAKEKAAKRKEKSKEKMDFVEERSASGSTKRKTGRQDSRLVTKLSQADENRIDEMNNQRKQKKYKADSLSDKADMVRRFNEFGKTSSDGQNS